MFVINVGGVCGYIEFVGIFYGLSVVVGSVIIFENG